MWKVSTPKCWDTVSHMLRRLCMNVSFGRDGCSIDVTPFMYWCMHMCMYHVAGWSVLKHLTSLLRRCWQDMRVNESVLTISDQQLCRCHSLLCLFTCIQTTWVLLEHMHWMLCISYLNVCGMFGNEGLRQRCDIVHIPSRWRAISLHL
jgi:hypothetical protein